MGRAPTLALCSRNARPEKGLVRRPHLDQRACPSQREKTSELGRIILVDHGARQGEERVLARWGWAGAKDGLFEHPAAYTPFVPDLQAIKALPC